MALAVFFALSVCSQSSAPKAQDLNDPSVSVQGWIEATAIVRDLDNMSTVLQTTAGYQELFSGATPREVLDSWGLPASSTGREVLLREPGETRGYIRLIQLSGVTRQIEARSAATFIDSGGIMGLNVRVKDIQKAFDKLQAAGWRPLSDPVSFSVDNFSVSEAVFLGPDSLVIGLIERQKPALGPEWRMPPGQLSRPNNAFIITSDLKQASDYYQTELGWYSFLEDEADKAAVSGMNIYGWPHNLVENIGRHVMWMHPDQASDTREGTIALIALDGVKGRDFSARTRPPNFGWTSLRILSDGADGEAEENGNAFYLAPYGCVTLSLSYDFDGTQIERLEMSKNCE